MTNNPPAFPVSSDVLKNTEGMTLRDYFATAVLQAILSDGNTMPSIAVKLAYDIADAMLVAREEGLS